MNQFFEFLIRKKYFNDSILINSIIMFDKRKPNIIELTYKKKLLPKKDIVSALNLMVRKNIGFKNSLVELKLFDETIKNAIRNEVDIYKFQFWEKILKSEKIERSKLNKAFFEFLEDKYSTEEEIKSIPIFFYEIDKKALHDYYTVFNEQFYFDIKKSIKSFVVFILKDQSLVKDKMRECYRYFHSLRKAAKSIDLIFSERLCYLAENIFSDCESKSDNLTTEKIIQLIELQQKIIDKVWDIKNSLEQNESEKFFWSKNNMEIISIFKKTAAFLHSIQSI